MASRDLRNHTAAVLKQVAEGVEVRITVRGEPAAVLTPPRRQRPLPIDAVVADEWALLRVELTRADRRITVNDLWVAATARAHRLPVATQDGDFDVLAEMGLVEVVRV